MAKAVKSGPRAVTAPARAPAIAAISGEERTKHWKKAPDQVIDPVLKYMAEAVFTARKKLGLTQMELSKKVGCTSGSIFLVEAGRHNMNIRSIMELAAGLEVGVGDLFPRTVPTRAERDKALANTLIDATASLGDRLRQLEQLGREIDQVAKRLKEDAELRQE